MAALEGFLAWVDDFRHDVVHSVRALFRAPVFAIGVVTTLAVGIGATISIVRVANVLLINALPYPEADRIVRIIDLLPPDTPGGAREAPAGLTLDEIASIRANVSSLATVGNYVGAQATTFGGELPARLTGTRFSAAFFSMFSATPEFGRAYGDAEEGRAATVAVLSYAAWQKHFGSRRNVLSETLVVDGQPFEIIGVMPAGFVFPDVLTDFWIPFVPPRRPGAQRFFTYGQLAPGATLQTATSEVSGLLQQLRGFGTVDDYRAVGESLPFGLVRLQDDLSRPMRPIVIMLAAGVSLLLLIACANVTNLLLLRHADRHKEIGVRLALGARRGRLIQQLLTESVLLAAIGSALGMLVAGAGLILTQRVGTPLPRRDLGALLGIPRIADGGFDSLVLIFSVAAALSVGLLCGLLPARECLRADPLNALKGLQVLPFLRSNAARARGVLVVSQLAMATCLLAIAALLGYSLLNLSTVDTGYDASGVLTLQIAPPRDRYGTQEQLTGLGEQIVTELRAIPGVTAAAYVDFPPMVRGGPGGLRMSVRPDQLLDQPQAAGGPKTADRPDIRRVSPDYFSVMRIPVLEGRGLSASDGAGAPTVALINSRLAKSGYLGPDPIGKHIYFGSVDVPIEVVGIVGDVRQFDVDQPAEPQVFLDARQSGGLPRFDGLSWYFLIRSSGDPALLANNARRAVAEADSQIAVVNVATMRQIWNNAILRQRLYTFLIVCFSCVAVVLSVVGAYTVVAHSTKQRTREMGIRIVLGATGSQVAFGMMRGGLWLTAVGIAIGLVTAAAISRYLQGLLFGIGPLDGIAFASVGALCAVVSTVACYLPVRKALQGTASSALRHE